MPTWTASPTSSTLVIRFFSRSDAMTPFKLEPRRPFSLWRALQLSAVSALVLFSGCSSSNSLISNKLDPRTAVTITYSNAPLVFYREESGRAAYARDYVHLGPLEINRAGTFRYYLWIGIWSTLPDTALRAPLNGFSTIVIYADGEPLSLEISGWTADAIGASEPVYLKPVASAADAYYEVTIDQLRFIAGARDVRVQTSGPRQQSYEPWDNQGTANASLDEFLRTSFY